MIQEGEEAECLADVLACSSHRCWSRWASRPAAGRTPPQRTTVVIDPIQVESVEVLVQAGDPPRASAPRARGDRRRCSSLHSVEQARTGSTVVLTILRERPANAICTQIARLYDETIRLDGAFPAGAYVLRVNGTEARFATN